MTINTAPEKERWLGAERKHPDIIGWQYHPKHNTVEWIAEVEQKIHSPSSALMVFGVPFYLFFPKAAVS